MASWLNAIIVFAGLHMMFLKSAVVKARKEGLDRTAIDRAVIRHYTAVTAGTLAYASYILAGLRAFAPFPQFLRDHLFDGLAPAALVAILVDLYPGEDPSEAFPRIRRPIMIVLTLFLSGAVIFGLIAMAAAFQSGTNSYLKAVPNVAVTGGGVIALTYITEIRYGTALGPKNSAWPPIAWWIRKRPLKSVKARWHLRRR